MDPTKISHYTVYSTRSSQYTHTVNVTAAWLLSWVCVCVCMCVLIVCVCVYECAWVGMGVHMHAFICMWGGIPFIYFLANSRSIPAVNIQWT